MPYMYDLYTSHLRSAYVHAGMTQETHLALYALYVCLICMPYMYDLYVCLICMPYMYALYVCLICMPPGATTPPCPPAPPFGNSEDLRRAGEERERP